MLRPTRPLTPRSVQFLHVPRVWILSVLTSLYRFLIMFTICGGRHPSDSLPYRFASTLRYMLVLQAAIAAVAQAAAAEFALDGYADGCANGGDVSDSSNESDAATTTDLHLQSNSGISQGQQYGGQNGSYRVGRRSDLSTLSSSWRASDCMPFGGGGGGVAASSPHRGSVYGGPVRMSLEGVSTSDGRCAPCATHCHGLPSNESTAPAPASTALDSVLLC
jgi:hypothetical protein